MSLYDEGLGDIRVKKGPSLACLRKTLLAKMCLQESDVVVVIRSTSHTILEEIRKYYLDTSSYLELCHSCFNAL